jgi:hypothetical protein
VCDLYNYPYLSKLTDLFGLEKEDGEGTNPGKPVIRCVSSIGSYASADSRKFCSEKMRITMGKNTTFTNRRFEVH